MKMSRNEQIVLLFGLLVLIAAPILVMMSDDARLRRSPMSNPLS